MKLVFAITLVCAAAVAGEKLKCDMKILNWQDHETDYNYVVPGYSKLNSNTNVGCLGVDNSVNRNGPTNATSWSMPAQQISYRVRGATFTLQLPDGGRAVVNCESKFQERFAGPRETAAAVAFPWWTISKRNS